MVNNSQKHNLSALFFCMACIALNLLLGIIVSKFELPLYLDTVGTIVASATGGFLPGVIVGFTTNIIKNIYDYTALYYSVLNVLVAFFAAWLTERGWLKKKRGILGMIIVFTLIGGGLGSFIPWFLDGLPYDSEFLSTVFSDMGFSLQTVYILSNISQDALDKTVTVFLVLFILQLIPQQYYCYFRFTGWMQTPVSTEDDASQDNSVVRVMSLKTKVMLVFSLSLTTVAVVIVVISMKVYRKTIVKEHTQIAQAAVEVAASILDGDEIDEYLITCGNTHEYREKEQLLQTILYSATDVISLYVYKIDEEGSHVVFDLDEEDVPGVKKDDISAEAIGTVIPIDPGYKNDIPALLAGKEVDPIVTRDEYGYLLTVYHPVYDSEGKCACYVGADVDMEQLTDMEHSFATELICVFMGFLIVLCVFVIWLSEYHIIYPINEITKCVDEYSNTTDSQEQLDEDVKKFRGIDVHTGDELEQLYKAVCKMTLNQAEQMRSIRMLSESTQKMQEGLIITMADMVENRDSDTGAHIQKTAAYVKIIVEGLKKKGYYAEKITPEFMSDVVKSAPLHDVGKINISDVVLNKPGKLTEEEYEIMKTHTTAGKQIIEKAIATVEGGSYLKEARNMAAYHHERWDGKGYPEGLHGEVIPLAARIMAVADVFDALTSPRVYKPAFPVEKALSIIEEGKGTQFDPRCVEVFMDSLPEVKEILKKYNGDM